MANERSVFHEIEWTSFFEEKFYFLGCRWILFNWYGKKFKNFHERFLNEKEIKKNTPAMTNLVGRLLQR